MSGYRVEYRPEAKKVLALLPTARVAQIESAISDYANTLPDPELAGRHYEEMLRIPGVEITLQINTPQEYVIVVRVVALL